ncbi:MAG: hypothetical protein AB7I08_08720 [Thermoleophilia bacterium]
MIAAAAAVPSTASGEGGTSIAAAPPLPVGQQTFGAIERLDFYKASLNAGDTLTVDFASIDGNYVQICMLKPEITDFTLAESECWTVSNWTETASQFRWTVPAPGAWTFLIANGLCIDDGGDYVTNPCSRKTSYAFTASVTPAPPPVQPVAPPVQPAPTVQPTSMRLTVWPKRRVGQDLLLSARVRSPGGDPSGRCAFQRGRSGKWVQFRVVRLRAGHPCRTFVRLDRAGGTAFRGFYLPDPGWAPAKATSGRIVVLPRRRR